MRDPIVQYSPPYGSAGSQKQSLTITCNMFTAGVLMLQSILRSTQRSDHPVPPVTTTTTTTTVAPTTTTTTTTRPPLPPGSTHPPTTRHLTPTPAPPTTPAPTPSGPVFCSPLPTVYVNTSTTSYLFPLNYVTNCVSPSIQFNGNTTPSLFTIASDLTTVVVDQYANNTNQDVYDVSLGIFCGGINVCLLSQRVVVTSPPVFTPAPTPAPLASCLPVYAYECSYGASTTLTVAGQDGALHIAECYDVPLISGPAINTANSLWTVSPARSCTWLQLSSVDAFQFAIQCDGVDLAAPKVLISVRNNSLPTPAPLYQQRQPQQPLYRRRCHRLASCLRRCVFVCVPAFDQRHAASSAGQSVLPTRRLIGLHTVRQCDSPYGGLFR